MAFENCPLIVIGENFNTTRRISPKSKRVVHDDGRWAIRYPGVDGKERELDVTEVMPEDADERSKFMIPHIAQALRGKDMDYIRWVIGGQEQAGAQIIDLCVDEISFHPEERAEWMRWLVKEAQSITDAVLAIDSSDTHCLQAGLEAYDASKNRPALNSVNLEKGRGEELIELAKEKNAYVFANASGRSGMPADAAERVANLSELMDIMDRYDIAVGDRFLDPLVFPIGAAPESANHYLGAVKALREKYPEVHIFGGHSNASFGMPGRKVMNNAFIILAILAGCDTLMIDPILTPPLNFVEFRLAADVITAKDEFAARYVTYWREKTGSKIR